MNREIVFRGKRVDNGTWVYGDLNQFEKSRYISDQDFQKIPLVQIDPSTVGQGTGLKDKNGNKIFEGDIVEILYTDWPSQTDYSISFEDYKKSISDTGEVVFKDHQWKLKFSSNSYGTFHVGAHGEIGEIIGNIHSTPELLNNPEKRKGMKKDEIALILSGYPGLDSNDIADITNQISLLFNGMQLNACVPQGMAF